MVKSQYHFSKTEFRVSTPMLRDFQNNPNTCSSEAHGRTPLNTQRRR